MIRRKPNIPWGRREDQTILELLDEGAGWVEIAAAIKTRHHRRRSSEACRVHYVAYLKPRIDIPRGYSARHVAQLIGVSQAVVRRWLDSGWLEGKRTGRKRGMFNRGEWFVTREAIETFVVEERYFVWWLPESIHEPRLRQRAIDARDGRRYLTLTGAGAWLGYSAGGLFSQVRNGRGIAAIAEKASLHTYHKTYMVREDRVRAYAAAHGLTLIGEPAYIYARPAQYLRAKREGMRWAS